MTNTLLKSVIMLTLCVLCVFIAMLSYKQFQPENPRLRAAEEAQEIEDIYFYGRAKQILFVSTSAIVLLSILIVTFTHSRATLKQASVYVYKLGKHHEFVVHERDLAIAAPIAMGLINAEQLRQMNGGVERAFELYTRMADVQSNQIQALMTPPPPQAKPEFPSVKRQDGPLPQTKHADVPTFRELLTTYQLGFGKPMILGFENGVPRYGSFQDIYSAAVAGESGSGKTATLLFLIGSAVISCPIRFIGIDPHYPHPKSLGSKTKPLWDAGLIRMTTYKDDMLAVLHEIEQTIDRRLRQVETDTTPVVLVIDELAFLTKTSIGKAISHTMERISMEGRKCAVYMLASSQTWLAARTGKSSVVRDTLTSAFVHRIKPKQANLLLQDKEESDLVKKHVKHAGDVLLCPVNDDPVVCKIPFSTEADMHIVVEMAENTPSHRSSRAHALDQECQKLLSNVPPAALPETKLSFEAMTADFASPASHPTTRTLARSSLPEWVLRNAA